MSLSNSITLILSFYHSDSFFLFLRRFPFPPKVWFFNFSEQTLQFRRRALQHFLRFLLQLSQGVPALLSPFLRLPQHMRKRERLFFIPSSCSDPFSSMSSFSSEGTASKIVTTEQAGRRRQEEGNTTTSSTTNPSLSSPPPPTPSSNSLRLQISDFQFVQTIGKGSFGKVLLVRPLCGLDFSTALSPRRLYAMKILSKMDVFEKNQIEHTIVCYFHFILCYCGWLCCCRWKGGFSKSLSIPSLPI